MIKHEKPTIETIFFITASLLLYCCNEQFLEKGISPIKMNSSGFLSQSPVVSFKTEGPNDAYIVVYKDQTTDKEIEYKMGILDPYFFEVFRSNNSRFI